MAAVVVAAAEDMDYDAMKEAVAGFFVRPLREPHAHRGPNGIFNPATLPLQEWAITDNSMVHAIDQIDDFKEDVDFVVLKRAYLKAIDDDDFSALPEPFGFKEKPPAGTKLQIAIFHADPPSKFIVKHLVFKDKMKPQSFQRLIYGEARRLKFTHPKIGVKVWQYTFENMGGWQFRQHHLTPEVISKSKGSMDMNTLTDEQVDEGFDYIVKEAPRTASGITQLTWLTKSLKNETPIKGWQHKLVKEAIKNLTMDGSLAKEEKQWYITLMDYVPAVRVALEAVLDDMSSTMLLGEPDAGKSPLGRSIIMGMCRMNKKRFDKQGDVCFRATNEFDFLRGLVGHVLMGDFLDDGGLPFIVFKILLAFLNVGDFESMVWARWGAAKWVQTQPRVIADNAYNPHAQPDNEMPTVPHADFVKMVEVAFHKDATEALMDAVFKRSAFIVNTKMPKTGQGWIYYRASGVHQKDVKRIRQDSAEYLTEEGQRLYGQYKDGVREQPPDFEAKVAQEQQWLEKVIATRKQERKEAMEAKRPKAKPFIPEWANVAIKKEVGVNAFKALKRSPIREVIDLDSPVAKRGVKRVGIVSPSSPPMALPVEWSGVGSLPPGIDEWASRVERGLSASVHPPGDGKASALAAPDETEFEDASALAAPDETEIEDDPLGNGGNTELD